MKYLSRRIVSWAIDELSQHAHPFIGITFLAYKKQGFKIDGETNSIPDQQAAYSLGFQTADTNAFGVDSAMKEHLESFHRPDPQSEWYFSPFKSSGNFTKWVPNDFASGEMRKINRQVFGSVFIRQEEYGEFVVDYIDRIGKMLHRISGFGPVSLAALGVWFGKEKEWEDDADISAVTDAFLDEFNLTNEEVDRLFSLEIGIYSSFPDGEVFSKDRVDLKALTYEFETPPDAPGRNGGMLASLELSGVGPVDHLVLEFGKRLTLITGDNGLGKSFLLDAAWWVITKKWSNSQATPIRRILSKKESVPIIKFEVCGQDIGTRKGESTFDWKTNLWKIQRDGPSVSALCIFARIDGSFSVFDQIRAQMTGNPDTFVNCFTNRQMWDGDPPIMEGLIRDWVSWESADDERFDILTRILERLSPEDLGTLEPGAPTRLPGDARQIPTIRHPYGEIPVVLSSAGVQRILLFAYIVIWAWQEHVFAARQTGEEICRRMIIVIDEVEIHLHPRWQRTILPALMSVNRLLNRELDIQIVASTHSPMVLASMETDFSSNSDMLHHLALKGSQVSLDTLEFYKCGDISAWLTSPAFGLRHARSREAESAIEAAKTVQSKADPQGEEVERVSRLLRWSLASDDPFWPRWIYFAERFGVEP